MVWAGWYFPGIVSGGGFFSDGTPRVLCGQMMPFYVGCGLQSKSYPADQSWSVLSAAAMSLHSLILTDFFKFIKELTTYIYDFIKETIF